MLSSPPLGPLKPIVTLAKSTAKGDLANNQAYKYQDSNDVTEQNNFIRKRHPWNNIHLSPILLYSTFVNFLNH